MSPGDSVNGMLNIEEGPLLDILDKFKKQSIFNPLGGENVAHFLTAGVAAFTPQSLEKSTVITDDRPYASFTYFGFGVSSINKMANLKLQYEIDLGKMGKPFAGDAQTYIHKNGWFGSTRPIPQGWNYEIGEGGKFAFNITGKSEYLLFPANRSCYHACFSKGLLDP